MGAVFENPLDYALQLAIDKFEGAESECEKIALSSLKRAKMVVDTVMLHGLEFYGLTFDQFCKQCGSKKNVFFLSDDEVKLLNKAFKIMDIMKN